MVFFFCCGPRGGPFIRLYRQREARSAIAGGAELRNIDNVFHKIKSAHRTGQRFAVVIG